MGRRRRHRQGETHTRTLCYQAFAVRTDTLKIAAPANPESVGELRRAVVAYARKSGSDLAGAEAVQLAVSEALTNVAMHAYRNGDHGCMAVEAWPEQRHLVVHVTDDGVGFVPRPNSPGMGIGLAVMAQAADDFAISNREGVPGTLVQLRFALSPEEAPTRTSN